MIMTIGVDEGHKFGTGAAKNLNETTENRKIGNELMRMLREHGHNVINCTSEVSQVNSQLSDIVNKANAQKLDIFCSIHLNAGGGHGTETYTFTGSNSAKQIAKRVNDGIVKSCNFRNRGTKEANFYVLKHTKAPAILIEVCFVDSEEDKNKYDYMKVAKAIFKGLTGKDYAPLKSNNPYVPPAGDINLKIGDDVTISKNSTHYATGQKMAEFVKGNTYRIIDIKSDRVLLDKIVSWVYIKNLVKNTPSLETYTVKIDTDILNVRKGPSTSYEISTTVNKNQVFTIIEEKDGWGKLKSGSGWISLKYTVKR